MSALDQLLSELTKVKRKFAGSYCDAIVGHLADSDIDTAAFEVLFKTHRSVDQYNQDVMGNQAAVAAEAEKLKDAIRIKIVGGSDTTEAGARTADSPIPIARSTLTDPSLINRAVSKEDTFRVDAHLTTLKLRLKTRLDDKRWRAFLNYEDAGTTIANLSTWFARFGLGATTGPKVSVLDLSMLSNEVLPYACAVIGRVLLEARERLPAASRYKHPWVLVLEEAHNYARPARTDEDRGHRLARLTYERIAKEGRKFGLSLIIASQRPSEISQTIISQCANFISHRLQNPDDIDHFRRIIPMQARRLLDQVTILSSGEAIVLEAHSISRRGSSSIVRSPVHTARQQRRITNGRRKRSHFLWAQSSTPGEHRGANCLSFEAYTMRSPDLWCNASSSRIPPSATIASSRTFVDGKDRLPRPGHRGTARNYSQSRRHADPGCPRECRNQRDQSWGGRVVRDDRHHRLGSYW